MLGIDPDGAGLLVTTRSEVAALEFSITKRSQTMREETGRGCTDMVRPTMK